VRASRGSAGAHAGLKVQTPTVTAARGQKIGVGDLIITRRNDPTIDFHLSTPNAESLPPVRNGDRWWVAAVDSGTNRVAAERMTDGARAVFDGAYLCEHVNLGYAVTTHSAQGVTCDSTRAVPSDSASRSLFYVAVTRGRTNNNVYLYENAAESDAAPTEEGRHRPIRGSDGEAADLARAVLARDDRPVTAHQAAAVSPASSLPSIVVNLLEAHRANVSRWRDEHSLWRDVADRFTVSSDPGPDAAPIIGGRPRTLLLLEKVAIAGRIGPDLATGTLRDAVGVFDRDLFPAPAALLDSCDPGTLTWRARRY